MPNENGSSRWNGKYGDEEAARRAGYAGLTRAQSKYPAESKEMRERQGEKAQEISDTVPRDVVKPIPSEDIRRPPNRPPT